MVVNLHVGGGRLGIEPGSSAGSSAEQLVLLIAEPSPEPFLDICLQNLIWFRAIWMFLCPRTLPLWMK